MKIGITINTSWNIYNFRKGLIEKLIEEGHSVFVIAPIDEYTKKLQELGCIFIPLKMSNKGYNPFKDLSLFFQYIRIIKSNNLDYLLSFTIKPNIYSSLASIFLNTRVITNISGLGTVFLTKSIGASIAKALYSFSSKFSYKIFFQNPDDRQLFLDRFSIKKEKTDLLPGSGIDLSKFTNNIASPHKKTITVIARTLLAKGIIEYIEAIKMLKPSYPDVSFQWVGKDEPNPKLGVNKKQMFQWEKEELITYIPFTDDVKSIIENSTIIVLPSYREGTPRSLLEAMAMKKPIVTTNVPGCTNLVNENGFLCDAQSPSSLKNAIEKAISLSNNELALLGAQSRRIVEKNFDQKIVIDKYINSLKKWK